MTKNDIWQLLLRKNEALSGEKVTMKTEQLRRLVDFVYDTAYAKGKAVSANGKSFDGGEMFNQLFGGIKR